MQSVHKKVSCQATKWERISLKDINTKHLEYIKSSHKENLQANRKGEKKYINMHIYRREIQMVNNTCKDAQSHALSKNGN